MQFGSQQGYGVQEAQRSRDPSAAVLGSQATPPDMTPAQNSLDRLGTCCQRAAMFADALEKIKTGIMGPQPTENVKDIGLPPEPTGFIPTLQSRIAALEMWLSKAEREIHQLSRM